ncbi:ferredoxin family protein [Desulfovibrio sp. 86]|uniref:4Fe-4S ferredoxin-type domain-containing protein n=1 Tax=uncultured Desulfovibrio sp. TaxID=167968 RepID=A0A212LA66_9BACT|nr:ferredoxin family protein [Desulfovibrio sp. 86]SCM74398.1 conserved hypothetical protein [uncultured Desulfovibrio sp.]VZH34810.1 conserved protein of unknown function [Desulfovibrio sp. 86]
MPAKTKEFTISINGELCKACGYCAEVCPKEVFSQAAAFNKQGYNPFQAAHSENCVGCLTCIALCPEFAISVTGADD